MIDNAGYLYDSEANVSFDHCERLVVCSCGHYKLVTVPGFETKRLSGRRDWQLLYIANGKATFYWEGQTAEVGAGNMVLYRPRQPQHYSYLREDYPEIYWLHFSGGEVEEMLGKLGLLEERVFAAGVQERYRELFEAIVQEMQLKPEGFSYMAGGLAQELLATAAREKKRMRSQGDAGGQIRRVMEEMYRTFREERSMEEYAQKYNMSLCWFIRRFKAFTGVSPHRFIMEIRISKARELLLNTAMNISEVAALVGYDNPLYFSRVFKKMTGLSPKDYRSRIGAGGG